VLTMATIGGARALGMERRIGSLEPGKRADIIVVSMSGARQTPMYDPISHLVYTTTGSQVQSTIVNGKVLMRNRKMLTLDEGAILKEARMLSEKVKLAVKVF
jgi:5-methylthioadenosine/S-adenosylhomocysteine deaminase